MIVGTSMFKMDGNPYYSPEFSRGGLAATFAVDVTHIVGSPNLTIQIESRNSEDTTWNVIGSFPVISATGTPSVDLTGLQEVVRFLYSFDGADQPNDGVHLLMMAPSWRPY